MARFRSSGNIIVLILVLALAACAPQVTPPAPLPTSRPPLPTQVPFDLLPTPTLSPSRAVIVGTISGTTVPLSLPIDVAVDKAGNIFVLDAGSNRVVVFDPHGVELRSWGGIGSAPGQFWLANKQKGGLNGYGGLALDTEGNVYVADASNHRIQKFDSTGKFLLQWGSEGLDRSQFLRPLSITIDADGHVYVIDDRASRIQEFDLQGKFIRAFGQEGSGNGQLYDTGNIAHGPDGNLYVADFGNKRVEVFSPDGKYVNAWATDAKPVGITVDPSGNVYVTGLTGYVTVYTLAGNKEGVMKTLGLKDPVGMAVTADGLIYIADQHNNRVLIVQQPD